MYHVGVSNIYELLDDENDEEGRKKVVATKTTKEDVTASKNKPTTSAKKEQPRKIEPAVAPVKATSPPKEKIDNKRPKVSGEKVLSDKPRRNREPKADGSSPFAGAERPQRTDKGEREKRNNEERKRDKEYKDKEFQGQKPSKRSYDKKSGTGRGKEIKKGGGGKGNWGKDNEQWEEVPSSEKQEKEDKPETEASKGETEVPAPVKEPTEEEKEAKLMTLEDYIKKKEAEKSANMPELPAPRQAGEGVDKKELEKWSKLTVFKRDEEEEEKSPNFDPKKEKKKEPKKQPVPLESLIKVQTKKSSPDRRNFKDSPRGGKRRTGTAPDVKDKFSFPALIIKA